MSFETVPLPVWKREAGGASTLRQIDAWLGSPPVLALVETFGGTIRSDTPGTFADALRAFAQATWDYRNGQERDVAQRQTFDRPTSALVVSAARALGLIDAVPPQRRRYDAILVLGGLIRACVVRPRYAAELVATGTKVSEIIGLGAFRPLSQPELALGERLGLEVRDEFSAMTRGVALAFEGSLVVPPVIDGHEVPNDAARSWRTVRWAGRRGDEESLHLDQVTVVAAPTSRANAKRANTIETYDFWARSLRGSEIRSLLVITNPIYVPYQGCAAIQALGLGHGLDVETVGVTTAIADLGDETQPFEPQDYLQEILSSINGMTSLRGVLEERLERRVI